MLFTDFHTSDSALTTTTAVQVLDPTLNVAGATIGNMQLLNSTGANGLDMAFMANTTSPVNLLDGAMLAEFNIPTGNSTLVIKSDAEITVPAGMGIYFVSKTAVANHAIIRRALINIL